MNIYNEKQRWKINMVSLDADLMLLCLSAYKCAFILRIFPIMLEVVAWIYDFYLHLKCIR